MPYHWKKKETQNQRYILIPLCGWTYGFLGIHSRPNFFDWYPHDHCWKSLGVWLLNRIINGATLFENHTHPHLSFDSLSYLKCHSDLVWKSQWLWSYVTCYHKMSVKLPVCIQRYSLLSMPQNNRKQRKIITKYWFLLDKTMSYTHISYIILKLALWRIWICNNFE